MSTEFSEKQIGHVLDEIALKTDSMVTLLSEALQCCHKDHIDECTQNIVAIRAMVERIGFLADHHAPNPVKGGDALRWMMHTAYHHAANEIPDDEEAG